MINELNQKIRTEGPRDLCWSTSTCTGWEGLDIYPYHLVQDFLNILAMAAKKTSITTPGCPNLEIGQELN